MCNAAFKRQKTAAAINRKAIKIGKFRKDLENMIVGEMRIVVR